MGLFERSISVILVLTYGSIVTFAFRKKEKEFVTPINVMMWPYIIIVVLVNSIGVQFGYFAIQFKGILFVLACITFFILGGFLIIKLFNNKFDELFTKEKIEASFNQYRKFFFLIAIISIIAGYVHFFNALAEVGGWIQVASTEFEDAYGKGVLAHVSLLNRPAFLFFAAYFLYRKNLIVLVLLVLMFGTVLLLQIKNNIISLLLAAFFFAYLLNLIKLSLKKLVLYSIIIFAIFNISYLIGFSRIGLSAASSSKVQEYLIHLFFSYLFGGPIGTSELFEYSQYPLFSTREVFAVPINIYNVLILGSSEVIDIIIRNWIPISTNYRFFHTTNVFGLFGMLYVYLGILGTFVYMFFLGLSAYLVRFLAYREETFIGFRLLYAFFLSYLTLAFFGLFFNIIIVPEIMIILVVLPLVNIGIKLIINTANHYK